MAQIQVKIAHRDEYVAATVDADMLTMLSESKWYLSRGLGLRSEEVRIRPGSSAR